MRWASKLFWGGPIPCSSHDPLYTPVCPGNSRAPPDTHPQARTMRHTRTRCRDMHPRPTWTLLVDHGPTPPPHRPLPCSFIATPRFGFSPPPPRRVPSTAWAPCATPSAHAASRPLHRHMVPADGLLHIGTPFGRPCDHPRHNTPKQSLQKVQNHIASAGSHLLAPGLGLGRRLGFHDIGC